MLVSYCFNVFFCKLLLIFSSLSRSYYSHSDLLWGDLATRVAQARHQPSWLQCHSQKVENRVDRIKKRGEFGKIIILQNGIVSTMCAWARSSIFWNWMRLATHCSTLRTVWLDDVQESVRMAVLGFRRSTAKTWPICSAQPYGPLLYVSFFFVYFCVCWCSFFVCHL